MLKDATDTIQLFSYPAISAIPSCFQCEIAVMIQFLTIVYKCAVLICWSLEKVSVKSLHNILYIYIYIYIILVAKKLILPLPALHDRALYL